MTTTPTPAVQVPVRVEVARYTGPGVGGYSVHPIWEGVDRPNVGGWVVNTPREVSRLTAALLAGAVYTSTEVRTDVEGQTYIEGRKMVYGRSLNADLRAIGF